MASSSICSQPAARDTIRCARVAAEGICANAERSEISRQRTRRRTLARAHALAAPQQRTRPVARRRRAPPDFRSDLRIQSDGAELPGTAGCIAVWAGSAIGPVFWRACRREARLPFW